MKKTNETNLRVNYALWVIPLPGVLFAIVDYHKLSGLRGKMDFGQQWRSFPKLHKQKIRPPSRSPKFLWVKQAQ